MGNVSQTIWVANAHVRDAGSGVPVAKGAGARVTIAMRAANGEDFEIMTRALLRQKRFHVVSIDKIESEHDVPKDESDPVAAAKIDLFKRLAKIRSSPGVYVWTKFRPYDPEEVM